MAIYFPTGESVANGIWLLVAELRIDRKGKEARKTDKKSHSYPAYAASFLPPLWVASESPYSIPS